MDLLWWAIIALVISVIAGAMGFSGIGAGAATISKVLFGIFLVIFFILLAIALLGVAAAA